MVQFTVEKEAILEAAGLLAQVANLRSAGASPAESSCILLTPTTMSIMNTNEANSILVENIPIAIGKGDIKKYLDQGLMINTKKMASIIRGCKEKVNFVIMDDKIAMGEGKRRFDLAVFSVEKKDTPEVSMFDYQISTDSIVKNLSDAHDVTERAANISGLSGTLFSGDKMVASDRLSALYIEKMGIFDKVAKDTKDFPDIIIDTNLFSVCLSKISEKSATPGFTKNREKVVLKLGNVTLYKTILEEQFPKDEILTTTSKVIKKIGEDSIRASVDLKEFTSKLHEIKEIVESDEYVLVFSKESGIIIKSSSERSGAGGEIIVGSKIEASEEYNNIGARFAFTHLDTFGKVFSDSDTIELHAILGKQAEVPVIKVLAARTKNKIFFCVPRVS